MHKAKFKVMFSEVFRAKCKAMFSKMFRAVFRTL